MPPNPKFPAIAAMPILRVAPFPLATEADLAALSGTRRTQALANLAYSRGQPRPSPCFRYRGARYRPIFPLCIILPEFRADGRCCACIAANDKNSWRCEGELNAAGGVQAVLARTAQVAPVNPAPGSVLPAVPATPVAHPDASPSVGHPAASPPPSPSTLAPSPSPFRSLSPSPGAASSEQLDLDEIFNFDQMLATPLPPTPSNPALRPPRPTRFSVAAAAAVSSPLRRPSKHLRARAGVPTAPAGGPAATPKRARNARTTKASKEKVRGNPTADPIRQGSHDIYYFGASEEEDAGMGGLEEEEGEEIGSGGGDEMEGVEEGTQGPRVESVGVAGPSSAPHSEEQRDLLEEEDFAIFENAEQEEDAFQAHLQILRGRVLGYGVMEGMARRKKERTMREIEYLLGARPRPANGGDDEETID
jgi:hypothetical protein